MVTVQNFRENFVKFRNVQVETKQRPTQRVPVKLPLEGCTVYENHWIFHLLLFSLWDVEMNHDLETTFKDVFISD